MPGPYERAKARPLRTDRLYSRELILDGNRLAFERCLVEPAAASEARRENKYSGAGAISDS